MSVVITNKPSYRGSRRTIYSVYQDGKLVCCFDEEEDLNAYDKAEDLKARIEKEMEL